MLKLYNMSYRRLNKILFCIVIILAILLFGPEVKALFVVKPTIVHHLPQNKDKSYTIMTVYTTAYNAGDVNQCWGDPCISASEENICESLSRGLKRCAMNKFPFGTWIYIPDYGYCKIVDRMNSRYTDRVDIAFQLGDKRAIEWGKQLKEIRIIK